MNIWRTVMTKEFEDRGTTYSIHENVNIGEVKVADEVVAIIAGLIVPPPVHPVSAPAVHQ